MPCCLFALWPTSTDGVARSRPIRFSSLSISALPFAGSDLPEVFWELRSLPAVEDDGEPYGRSPNYRSNFSILVFGVSVLACHREHAIAFALQRAVRVCEHRVRCRLLSAHQRRKNARLE